MWKESCPQCTTRSHASSSNNFFPRFYDLMLGLHLFSCRGVRSEQFVKGKNSPSSRRVCIWSSASAMTLWKSWRRDEVIGHLAWDLKRRREEGHKRWGEVAVSHHPLLQSRLGAAFGDGVCLAVGRESQEPSPGVGKCCAPTPGVNPAPGWSHLKFTWTPCTMQWSAMGILHPSQTSQRSRKGWPWNTTVSVTCSAMTRKTFTSKYLILLNYFIPTTFSSDFRLQTFISVVPRGQFNNTTRFSP